jgi:hypothetical protein
MQALFYRKVPLLQVPSPRLGKGIYALYSYMTRLDFVTEPSFMCPNDEASDMAINKATHTIGGQDVVEEYMACGLFPLSTGFNLGEIADGKTPLSKLVIPLPEFPIARHQEEMNDGLRAMVELAVTNIIDRYARKEHKLCAKMVPNRDRVNRVFEQAGVPYGPHLEPGSEACKEAIKKRKSDVGVK